ncbi:hypothetical protein LL033_10015 [Clostridium estertheticum]|uniref:hypothetical protein n=1 Tax=Clostridium estertheticum TaxID=238834 RepID=UPI001C0CE61E|nr:hypothetical protein [Clostridium estertheticum]MBU3217804.1 hypothetical protein [Clostridium estertheticum]WAG57491.1 hypothetical protein LL033_10015 [Clostridium estertheticum]
MKNEINNKNQFFKDLSQHTMYSSLIKELNEYSVRTNLDENIKHYNEFCDKAEVVKANFVNEMIRLYELKIITDDVFNKALDPQLPVCNYNNKAEIFTMDFNFIPHVKSMYSRDVYKVKNALICMIMQGIKRMVEKPHYGTEPILIIFSVYHQYIFDVDNIELKYVIDAMRY